MRRFQRSVSLVLLLTAASVWLPCLAVAQGDAGMPNPAPYPDENPPLPGQDVLGKLLFWEEQLSFDNTMSCGTCHIPESGGSDPRAFKGTNPGPDGLYGVHLTNDDIAGSPGVVREGANGTFLHEGVFFPKPQVTSRKAPSVINAVFDSFDKMFWDGHAPTEYYDPVTGAQVTVVGGALESVTAMTIVSPVEMGAAGLTWQQVTDKLEVVKPMALAVDLPAECQDFLDEHETYPDMMSAVYGSPDVTPNRIVFAIATYMRTQISDETQLDKLLKGEIEVLPPDLQPGFDVFSGKGGCTSCHVMPFTADGNFHNIGARPDLEDIGLMAVTGNPADMARFKTPNVRNAKLRGALFHGGSVADLQELVDFYDENLLKFQGPNLDPLINNLYLTEAETDDLVHFLEEGVTDPRVEQALFPFSRPTLRSELPSLNSVYGVASVNGAGVPMDLIAHAPANIGNPNWLLGAANATPNQAAVFALATAPDPGGTPLSSEIPVPMNIRVNSIFLIVPAATDAFGVSTLKLSIPLNPMFAGLTFFAQVFVADPLAPTGGVYGSQGVSIGLF